MALEKPIIILGPLRSGTTWMGKAFERHPRIAYSVEPRHVWMYKNAYKPHFRLTEEDATDEIKRHIRGEFESFMRDRGADFFCEKTPSNCLRVPFILEVFPDARVVFLVRDGRSVVRSINEITDRGGVGLKGIVTRAAQPPLSEWPAYAPRALAAIRSKVIKGKPQHWGPRPPGWQEIVAEHPNDVALAILWALDIRYATDDLERCIPGGYLKVRYEDIVRDPATYARRITDHCELPDPEPIIDYITETADADGAERWRGSIDPETLELIRPHRAPTINELGYTW